ncbi:MAG TPA: hypothetical protein VGO47_05905, partial [Chlamydiales bacterium]|nr:hypothetical protein [Chlamydiales bacterium]
SDTRNAGEVPMGAIICVVLAPVVLTSLCIWYFQVLRRKRVRRLDSLEQPMRTRTWNVVSAVLPLSRQDVIEPYIFSESTVDVAPENPVANSDSTPPIRPEQQRSSMTNEGQINPVATSTHTTLTSTAQQNVDLVSTERENRRTGRRAVDAGPVFAYEDAEEEDDGASTLPPAYGDIFDISRSPTVSSRR